MSIYVCMMSNFHYIGMAAISICSSRICFLSICQTMIYPFPFPYCVQLCTVIVFVLISLSLSSRALVKKALCIPCITRVYISKLKAGIDDASLISRNDILKVPCLPMQISRPLSLPPSARDNLYHGLPITVKSALRSRLQTYNTEEEVCLLVQPCSAQMFHFLSMYLPCACNL
jgi:hypothetical protein